ncbi:MAG: ArsR family transcriptional regulator, partial [Nitrosopumilaceae archaeon]|nr:winged helix-turn-helix transcriptional regulator [Nitrosopumilaceae archaeon]NIX61276.1 ArsR family transcriptional regulator [Nitrosopumilaceae archaeon]
LKHEPMNINQLAKRLSLDYKAIQHHIRVLEKNNLLKSKGKKYDISYLPSEFLQVNMEVFEEIAQKL